MMDYSDADRSIVARLLTGYEPEHSTSVSFGKIYRVRTTCELDNGQTITRLEIIFGENKFYT